MLVIAANAVIQLEPNQRRSWIPAFAGMTGFVQPRASAYFIPDSCQADDQNPLGE
jgi:hypothetical protein